MQCGLQLLEISIATTGPDLALQLGTMRCLVIDDDASPRGLMEALLSRGGHRTTACDSGAAGVAAARAQGYDVAIVDMEMPGWNGATTISALREACPDIRVLVVSGYGDRKRVLAAIEAGADGYILKDEISEALASSLQEVRAGYTPLSPRVAAVMLRQLRKSLGPQVVEANHVARVVPRRPV